MHSFCLVVFSTILICADDLVITFIQPEYLFVTCAEELGRKLEK